MDSIRLRPATSDDAPALAAVFDAAVRVGWAYLGEVARRPLFTAEHWIDLVAEHAPSRALIVAEDPAGAITGFAAAHTESGELYLLFVDPAHAGRGVGRTLLAAAHDALRAAGWTEAYLYTEERNTRPRAVYAAAGYRPDGTVRESDFHGQALRELRLVCKLG